MMFRVEDGGVSVPIKWSPDALQSDKIIMVIDENTNTIYLWEGKLRGLVSKRTAMRQAQSLKGHGYQVGKSIIGRNLEKIIEIDERKVGRVPEVTEAFEEFKKLLNKPVIEVGNYVVTFGKGGEEEARAAFRKESGIGEEPAAPAEKKAAPSAAAAPTPTVKKSEPSPAPEIKKVKEPEPVAEEIPGTASEYEEEAEETQAPPTPSAAAPSVTAAAPKLTPVEEAHMGLVIMAVIDHFKDIWASLKPDGSIVLEEINGKICQFSIKDGKVKFTPDSFERIEPEVKNKIRKRFMELVAGLAKRLA